MGRFHVVATLFLRLTIVDQDYDGSWNHLLEAQDPAHHNPLVSFSSKSPLPFKEGQIFEADLDMQCFLAWGYEEDFTDNPPRYRAELCDADFLKLRGDKEPRIGIDREEERDADAVKAAAGTGVGPGEGKGGTGALDATKRATAPR